MALRIVLLGAPGVGKGTQARELANQFQLPHISTGEIFRSHVEQASPLGEQVREYMNNGTLVPDDLTCQVVLERLEQDDCSEGYILDGFPRSMPQAHYLSEYLEGQGESLNLAITIEVPDEELVERLCARRFCPACGAIYNMKFDPPAQDQRCDREDCGQPLAQRSDDTEETVRERLRIYHDTTAPILDYYRRANKLQVIPGSGLMPAAVQGRIGEVIAATQAV
jgi:adenylate kinase